MQGMKRLLLLGVLFIGLNGCSPALLSSLTGAAGNQSASPNPSPGLDLSATLIAPQGISFNKPDGVAVDASGDIYVVDTGNDAIKVLH